jgi:hypothetical protein
MFLDNDDQSLPATLTEKAENVLFAVAEELGLIMTEAEAQVLIDFEGKTNLNEAQNIVRLNRQSKLNAFTVRSAIVIAQQRKDPVYVKYARASMLKRKFRMMLVKKYASQANVTARRLLANAGKKNMVDVSSSRIGNPDSKR